MFIFENLIAVTMNIAVSGDIVLFTVVNLN
jgi:hypothetical protein